MWSCDQSLVTLAFLREKFHKLNFIRFYQKKPNFFEGCCCFKFNGLGLALVVALKFYTSVAKGLKLKVIKFWGLTPTFVGVTGEKLGGDLFAPSS